MTNWDNLAARYRSIRRCEHGTVVEEAGLAYSCHRCEEEATEAQPAEAGPMTIQQELSHTGQRRYRADCPACTWRGRPRTQPERAERDATKHEATHG